VHHSSEWMAYYSKVRSRKRRVLHLESRCYNKSHPSPKVYRFSKIDDRKPPLLVSKRCLTFLSSICTSLTSNQVCFLVHIYRRAMLVHLQANTLHGVSPPMSHVISISPLTSRTILFYLSKWTSLLTTPNNRFYWRPLLWERTITTQLWNLKVLFFLWHSIKSLDQEDCEVKSHTSSVMRNHHIHRKEKLHEKLGRLFSDQWFWCAIPLFSTSSHFASFSCASPPFVNLRTRFHLRGEGCNTPCYGILKYHH
jgi:hypothetical protein